MRFLRKHPRAGWGVVFAAAGLVLTWLAAPPGVRAPQGAHASPAALGPPGWLFLDCGDDCSIDKCSGEMCSLFDLVGSRYGLLDSIMNLGRRIGGSSTCVKYCKMKIVFENLEPGPLPGPVCACTNNPMSQPFLSLVMSRNGVNYNLYNGTVDVGPEGATGDVQFADCVTAADIMGLSVTKSVLNGNLYVRSAACPADQCERLLPMMNASMVLSLDEANCRFILHVACRPTGICVPCP